MAPLLISNTQYSAGITLTIPGRLNDTLTMAVPAFATTQETDTSLKAAALCARLGCLLDEDLGKSLKVTQCPGGPRCTFHRAGHSILRSLVSRSLLFKAGFCAPYSYSRSVAIVDFTIFPILFLVSISNLSSLYILRARGFASYIDTER